MTSKQVLEKLQESKLLTVQDYEKVRGDHMGLGQDPRDYSYRDYPDRLKEYLGVDVKIVSSEELNREIGNVEENEAEKLADTWINEAKEVRRGVARRDVIRAAKLCVALKELVKRYDADAVTMASWHLTGTWGDPKINVMPPLAWMELSKEHIPCCCQGLVDCLVTQMIGTYITNGYAGFVGDILNEWLDWDSLLKGASPGEVVIIGHCGAPITPHGDDRIPYTIRDHIINGADWAKLFGPEDTVTATTVDWPSDEVASVVKSDVYRKRVLIFTGTVLDGNSLYKNFPDTSCRNKIVIKIDESGVYRRFSRNLGEFRESWGNHLVTFYGNLEKEIKDLARLIGFEVMEGELY
jgi:hypothetical protein